MARFIFNAARLICLSFIISCSQGLEEKPAKKAVTSTGSLVNNHLGTNNQTPVKHIYHDVEYEDRYGWVRGDAPKGKLNAKQLKLFERENFKTNTYFQGKDKLLNTVYSELKKRRPSKMAAATIRYGNHTIRSKFLNNQPYKTHFITYKGINKETVLFDENVRSQNLEYFELGRLLLSSNSNFLAWTEDALGYGAYKLYVKDLKTGEVIFTVNDVGRDFVWSPDSQRIFYAKRNSIGQEFQARGVDLSTKTDFEIFTENDKEFFVSLEPLNNEKGFLIISFSLGQIESRLVFYDDKNYSSKVLISRDLKSTHSLNTVGDYLVLMTNRISPNFTIERKVFNDEEAKWEEIYHHENQSTIKHVVFFKDKLAVIERKAGIDRLFALDPLTLVKRSIEFKDELFGLTYTPKYQFRGENSFIVKYQSFLSPPILFEVDLISGKKTILSETRIDGFDPHLYEVKREFAFARDGVKIPVTIISQSSGKKARPLILYVYGAYGDGVPPEFPSVGLSLIDRGYRYAIAHVRGGDEMGVHWHNDGKLKKRMNSFYDYIDVAHHLIGHGYVKKGNISALGESGSGQTIGFALNEAPELFRSASMLVPFVDTVNTLMDDSLDYTLSDWAEFGNPVEDKSFFDLMMKYSPYENIKPQAYPPIFVTAGLHDPAVGFWEPVKWILKIRDYKTNKAVMLVDIREGGHYSSARDSVTLDLAKEVTFILSEGR